MSGKAACTLTAELPFKRTLADNGGARIPNVHFVSTDPNTALCGKTRTPRGDLPDMTKDETKVTCAACKLAERTLTRWRWKYKR